MRLMKSTKSELSAPVSGGVSVANVTGGSPSSNGPPVTLSSS
jgi:hypothetical protein